MGVFPVENRVGRPERREGIAPSAGARAAGWREVVGLEEQNGMEWNGMERTGRDITHGGG